MIEVAVLTTVFFLGVIFICYYAPPDETTPEYLARRDMACELIDPSPMRRSLRLQKKTE